MKNTVGVIGLGYVGLPLLMAISESGFNGLGFDIIQSRPFQTKQLRHMFPPAHFPQQRI
jgi:UDP-N-acetyl-D-mannosaminuronate dehydrogenase